MKGFAKALVLGSALAATAAGGAGCLTRPVGQQPPTTKDNFIAAVSQAAVDKVDLLVMIDNSSSMGDKQAILADAVPNLINGLLKPACVDANGTAISPAAQADPKGNKENHYGCPGGSDPEFTPVTDMHIGVISSSLGSFGGDVCPDTGRYNDHAHLLAISKGGGDVSDAKPSNFLAWFPSGQDPTRHPGPGTYGGVAIADDAKLGTDFQNLVVGVDQSGCGLEAQLESIYHFLIQPDPWVKVSLDGNNQADFGDDIDIDLLQQRADFLRPDSLVAVIALTDEDDSSADPLSVGGQGWAFMANQFPGSTVFRADGKTTTAPRGTSACKTNPGSPDCTSCGFASTCNASDPACQKIKNDPECQKNGGYYGANEDQLNVRFHRMKERFGIDPQYPISRYVDGFTKAKVPDRKNEHPITVNGGRRIISGYAPTPQCTNPLFAAKLPRAPGDEICKLAPSTRTSALVFFAVVGGVPNQLLYKDLAKPNETRISPPDWTKILGQDPLSFNYTGIDPHMIQSVQPRQGLPGPSSTRGDNGSDPVHGREWDTANDDLQYACTFDLPTPRTCAANDPSCDCPPGATKNPPLCAGTGDQQIKAKAYPTIREFEVVRAMGDNGIIASLCPLTLEGDTNSPSYGYNPAVAAIVERLKNALTAQCLPRQLTRDAATNEVPCLVLAQLGDPADNCEAHGLKAPPPEILDKFLEQQKEASGDIAAGGTDLSKLPVCEVPQKTVAQGDTCKDDTNVEWCYVENAPGGKNPAGRCPQALIITGALPGARFSLQCIQQYSPGEAAGESGGQNPPAAPPPAP
jgi:hypothetical protein